MGSAGHHTESGENIVITFDGGQSGTSGQYGSILLWFDLQGRGVLHACGGCWPKDRSNRIARRRR